MTAAIGHYGRNGGFVREGDERGTGCEGRIGIDTRGEEIATTKTNWDHAIGLERGELVGPPFVEK